MIAAAPERREVVTPEGVPLHFAIAPAGDRAGAFLIDCLALLAASVALLFLTIALVAAARGVGVAVGIVCFFVLRNFYFSWFECLWQGATPGKRLLHLRVVDARGGPLSAEAVFARNLMREVETFIPIAALLLPGEVAPGAPRVVALLAVGWLFVFALLPLFNRDHARVGDFVAGTRVVRAPRMVLLEDLSQVPPPPAAEPIPVAFTAEQLDVYGIHELQVLEGLLRRRPADLITLGAVAAQIRRKLGYASSPIDAESFLLAFYKAQRQRLEQRLLLGDRREAKRPARVTRTP